MGKIGFIFSGQGDQYSGMGKEFYEKYPSFAKVFDACDSVRQGTKEMCFSGAEEDLKETSNTQPCLFAYELACVELLKEKGIVPLSCAGFSLGEVSACTAAGIFDLETGFKLVSQRGKFMSEEAKKVDASMMAVVKLTEDKLLEICDKFENVYAVNFNCPGQITVSGLSEEMDSFAKEVKEAGGRALPLKVKGGFHSPFMKKASESFYLELKGANHHSPCIPVYSNLTSEPYTENVEELLSAQICNPVKWEKSIKNMISAGIDTFVEIGPGKTLTNMMARISTEVKAYSFSDYLNEVEKC